ncbi:MAG: magnesium transporter [Candidatus Babeliales bacterium]
MVLDTQELMQQVQEHIELILANASDDAPYWWARFISLHAADIEQILSGLSRIEMVTLFSRLSRSLQLAVFAELSDALKVVILSTISDEDKKYILTQTSLDDLTDLFDSISDDELQKYLTMLSTQDRKKILSLLNFDPESAGGNMETEVITLMSNFTVEKSIQILQRLQPRRELYQEIYVTDQDNVLVGHIRLEELVLHNPQTRIGTFMHKNDLLVAAAENQEEVAKKMIHYNKMTIPVVGDNNYFLGVISSDTLVDIIEEEASENVYRISAMTPIKYPYFETPFFRILYERSYILIILLLAQSLSSMIIKRYEVTLAGFLMYFITMLISTGGNSSSQTSALVIQGMAAGDITQTNFWRFFKRECYMAALMAVILGIFSFMRVYLTYGHLVGAFAVSLSLSIIVLVSVLLGSGIPIFLKKINIDPAYAAGPFLATLMDILGLLIYCYVSKFILG